MTTDFSLTRAMFDLPEGVIYLDSNSLGPLPLAVKERMGRVVGEEWGGMLIRGWNEAGWMEDGLLAFAFHDRPQDLNRFRNEPFWRERFGDVDGEQRFRWTVFYSAVAAKLLD